MPRKSFCLEITTNIGCVLNCKYCPQNLLVTRYNDTSKGNQKFLSYDTFCKCLEKVLPGCAISFCGMSEPFLNQECSKMIKYAYEKGHKITLYTTLVGFREKDFEELKDIKFESICIHIPDAEGNAPIPVTKNYLHILKQFLIHFPVDAFSCHGTVHSRIEEFVPTDAKVRTKLHYRAGHVKDEKFEHFEHKGKISCVCGINRTGFSPNLLPDGRVTLCPNDYTLQHVLGNLYTEEWCDIAAGKAMKKVLDGFEDDSINNLCRKCHVAEEGFNQIFLSGPINALRLANKFSEAEQGTLQLNTEQAQIFNKIMCKKNICVFGAGKLFCDNYYDSMWNDVIQANLICDNNKNNVLKNNKGDLQFIEPEKLKNIEDLLVITYVKDDTQIREQLKQEGIEEIYNVYEIYNMFN